LGLVRKTQNLVRFIDRDSCGSGASNADYSLWSNAAGWDTIIITVCHVGVDLFNKTNSRLNS
jgi:hypothetical protein